MRPSFQGGAHHMMQFMAMQNTACSDASSCAPATCCAASACTADCAATCKDTAILVVSFFIMILVSICLSILGIFGLSVRLVLVWGLVGIMILAYKFKMQKATAIVHSETA